MSVKYSLQRKHYANYFNQSMKNTVMDGTLYSSNISLYFSRKILGRDGTIQNCELTISAEIEFAHKYSER